jgi:putative phosphoesterase
MPQPHLIGVISDTHGLQRLEAVQALQGSELIIHAGGIGNPEILDGLRKIAPIAAIRGNVDHGIWAQGLPQTRTVEIGGVRVFLIHNINDLSIDAAAAGCAAVISGHSHRPSAVQKNGVVFLNPRSAGPRRFDLSVSVAVLRVLGKTVKAQVVELRGSNPL